jgi:ATPase subunit of ABC transporter with duplicated ATPase domains
MGAEARLSRQVRLLGRAVERADEEIASATVTRQRGRSLVIDFHAAPMSTLIQLDRDAVRAGDATLLSDVHLTVTRTSRVHLAGENGSGKSTLLAELIAEGRARREHLLYLPQELTAAEALRQRARIDALEAGARQRVLNTLAALGSDPDRVIRSRNLSPGEARKLMIAYGLGVKVWGMLLDEPTNHLDLPAIERLQAALADYPGSLVVITHDHALAAAVTDVVWEVCGQSVVVRGREAGP